MARPGSCKALPSMQRGLRGIATGLSLHHDKAATETPGGPYGSKTVAFQDKISKQKHCVSLVLKKP